MTTWLVAGLAIFVGSVLQRVSGTGVGLVCAPTLALLLGSAQGVLVTNATTTVSGFLIMLAVREHVDWPMARTVVLSALPGAVAGALLVRALPAAWLQVVIGAVVLLAIVVTVSTPRLPHWPGRGAAVAAGAVGGLFNTTAGVAAPVMVVYSRVSQWEQRSFAATLQPIFMSMGLMSVVLKSLLSSGPGELPPPWFLLVVVGTVVAGIRAGGLLLRRITAERARALALTLAGLGGVVTLGRGVPALLG